MTDFFYLKKYLHEHKYYHLEDKIILELQSHPDYPSLIAIVDVLHFYDIENVAARIDESELINLPETFLSVFCTHTGSEIVYTKKRGLDFEIQFANGFVQKLSRAEYLSGWNGMIVAIEENENKKDRQGNMVSKNAVLFLLGFCVVGLFQVYLTNFSNPGESLFYTLCSLVGVIISLFLVREDLGFHDAAISRICYASKRTSCSEVLSSNGAKILGNLKLSDVSLAYFSVLTFFSICTVFQNSLVIYNWLALLSIPILLYSVFTQYFIVKKWCVLCLGIVITLMFQIVVVSIQGFNFILNVSDIKKISLFLFVFALMNFVWIKIKNLIKSDLSNRNIELKYNQLKRKYVVFKALADADTSVNEVALEKLDTIVIGDDNAPIALNAVLSASCMHCHKVYENLMKLWSKNSEHLKIKLVFNINAENLNNPYNIIYKQAISLDLSGEYDKVIALLNDWHVKRMSLENWKSKWEFGQSETGIETIQEQYNWCLENKILHTPAIILNGKLLPKEYEVQELNFFIDNLIKEKTLVF